MKTAPVILACTLALAACADQGYRGPINTARYSPGPRLSTEEARALNGLPPMTPSLRKAEADAEAAAEMNQARTDAECRYEAAQGSANTPGLLMPAAVFGNLYQLCIRARS